jgi:hypothetical protein
MNERQIDMEEIWERLKGRYENGGKAAIVVLVTPAADEDKSVEVSCAFTGTNSALLSGVTDVTGVMLATIAHNQPGCKHVNQLLREFKRILTREAREKYAALLREAKAGGADE